MDEDNQYLNAESVEASLEEFDIDEGIEASFDNWQEVIASHETVYRAYIQARIYLQCQDLD